MKRFLSLLIALSCAAQAQPRYTTIVIAKGYGNGINSQDDVVGTLTPPNPTVDRYSFLYKEGKLTVFGLSVPHGPFQNEVVAAAVNDSDEVVGSARDGIDKSVPELDAFFTITKK